MNKLVSLLSLLFLLTGCTTTQTPYSHAGKFAKIKPGMSKGEVEAFMTPPKHVYTSETGQSVLVWEHLAFFKGALQWASVVFERGTVVEKRIEPITTEGYVRMYPHLAQNVRAAILDYRICVGLTEEQVILIRGKPMSKNTYGSPHGEMVQWVYGTFPSSVLYIYFVEGRVTSWQSLN